MAPNKLIHCDIAKMNFSFSMVSNLMNQQLKKYECEKEGNIVNIILSIMIFSAMEKL